MDDDKHSTFSSLKASAKDLKETSKEKFKHTVNKERSMVQVAQKVTGKLQNAVDSLETKNSEMQQGEKFRQQLDNTHPVEYTEIIGKYEIGKRVGRIQFVRGTSVGTGFRVGSKYVMTAYHVMENNLKWLWEKVHKLLSEEERKIIEWTKDKLPVTGSWNISKLITSLDPPKRDELMGLAKYITEQYEIKFEFLREGAVGRIAKFKPDIAFVSPENDVLVLELADQESETKVFGLVEYNNRGEKLHVFGHPSGKPLQHDPACTIVDNEEKLSKLKTDGITFFKQYGKKEKNIKDSYAPCVISEYNILFHSSSSTAHGASGAPLAIVDIDTPKVYGMLQCGHPGIYYNCSFKGEMKSPHLLVESGISMRKVRSLLRESSLPELEKELFGP